MEVNIPLEWKPLNLEQYDGTTDPDEHLDAFMTHGESIHQLRPDPMCVFPMSLKRVTLTWCSGLPLRSIDIFDTLVERFSVQYTTNRSHCMTLTALANLR